MVCIEVYLYLYQHRQLTHLASSMGEIIESYTFSEEDGSLPKDSRALIMYSAEVKITFFVIKNLGLNYLKIS